jgi:hypothetical protein
MRIPLRISAVVSAVLSAAMLLPASAQAVGNVISSTPVLKRVTEPVRGCSPAPQRACEMATEDRLIGYKVVYEYNGKQHEVQLPFAVGATIPLETSGSGVQPASTPSTAPTPTYERSPRVVERVYVEPGYRSDYGNYTGARYDPYYYGPIVPLGLTLGLGYVAGRYYWPRGYVYYGGHGGWRGHRR